MEAFYWWLRTSDNLVYACEPIALSDMSEVHAEGLLKAWALRGEMLNRGFDTKSFLFEITDRGGQVLLKFPLADLFS
jgi:hypothetical protein